MLALCFILAATWSGLQAQLNEQTVCRTLINQLNCTPIPHVRLCGNDNRFYSSECEYAKAKCLNAHLHVTHCDQTTHAEPTTTPRVRTTVPHTTAPHTTATHTTAPRTTAPHTLATAPPTKATTAKPTSPTHTIPPITSSTHTPTTSPYLVGGSTLSPLCQGFVTRDCSTLNSPVCGSDGKTYNNFCLLEQRKCIADSSLSVLHTGVCQLGDFVTTTKEPLNAFELICAAIANVACPADNNPVCGSNQVTYSNACELEKAKCKNPNLVLDVIAAC